MLCNPATWCNMPVWQARGRDQIFRKILLKVISSDLNSDEGENQRAGPYSERQELRKSIVLVSGSQQEVCSMQLALRIRSFLMEAMSSSKRLQQRMCPKCFTDRLSWSLTNLKLLTTIRESVCRGSRARVPWIRKGMLVYAEPARTLTPALPHLVLYWHTTDYIKG